MKVDTLMRKENERILIEARAHPTFSLLFDYINNQ